MCSRYHKWLGKESRKCAPGQATTLSQERGESKPLDLSQTTEVCAVLTRQFGNTLLVGALQTRDIRTDITARLEPRPLDFLQGFFVCCAC